MKFILEIGRNDLGKTGALHRFVITSIASHREGFITMNHGLTDEKSFRRFWILRSLVQIAIA